jgi:hypothetical protein
MAPIAPDFIKAEFDAYCLSSFPVNRVAAYDPSDSLHPFLHYVLKHALGLTTFMPLTFLLDTSVL